MNLPTPLKKAASKDTALPSTHRNKAIRVLFSRLLSLPAKPWFLRSPIIPLETSNNPDNFFFPDYNCTVVLVSYFLQQLKGKCSAESFQQGIRLKEVQTVAGAWAAWTKRHGQICHRQIHNSNIVLAMPLWHFWRADAHLLIFFWCVFWFLTLAWIQALPGWNCYIILISMYLSQSQSTCNGLVMSPFPPAR